MILNLYTYKGSLNSLIGPWITTGFVSTANIPFFLQKQLALDIESIPASLENYNYLLKDNFSMISIKASTINIKGELSIFEAENKIIAFFKSIAIEKKEKLKINKFITLGPWQEKLTLLCAYFYHKEYLLRNSDSTINYVELENDIEKHKELICSYKLLPPNYILNKCIDLCQNVKPRPAWLSKELIDLQKILGEK